MSGCSASTNAPAADIGIYSQRDPPGTLRRTSLPDLNIEAIMQKVGTGCKAKSAAKTTISRR